MKITFRLMIAIAAALLACIPAAPGISLAAFDVPAQSGPAEDAETVASTPDRGIYYMDPEVVELMEKGSLASIYGTPQQAIGYFSKAVKKDPESAPAHFALGMACSDAAMFDRAFSHVNKAISLDPANPDYLYGRARVCLLSGDEAKARQGFAEAAAQGSLEAKRYLDRMGEKK